MQFNHFDAHRDGDKSVLYVKVVAKKRRVTTWTHLQMDTVIV